MDPHAEERQRLQEKVKQLEQQIVVRARNFTPTNRSQKNKVGEHINLHAKVTSDFLEQGREPNLKYPDMKAITQLHQEYQNIIQKISSNSQIGVEGHEVSQTCIKTLWLKHIQVLNKGLLKFSKVLNEILATKLSCAQTFQIASRLIQQIKNCCGSINVMQSEIDKAYGQKNHIKIRQMEENAQKQSKKVRQLQNRCQVIVRALNQSEEANYQLRLQVQDCEIKVRNSAQLIQAQVVSLDALKVKTQQLEVMKKQYLRAYSKIKQQKQSLSLKLIDLQLETQQFRKKEDSQYCEMQSKDERQIQSAELKTIQQQNEQDEAVAKSTAEKSMDSRPSAVCKFSEDLIQRIGVKVFEIISNLPYEDDFQIMFTPSNQSELEYALDYVHRFCLNFSQYQQALSNQFDREAKVLIKIIEQISITKNVSAEQMIDIMKTHYEQNSKHIMLLKNLIKMLADGTMDSDKKQQNYKQRQL